MTVTLERRPATVAPDHAEAPILAILQEARRRGITPLFANGHKLGTGADRDLVALLGADVFASDLWLNSGELALRLRAAEALAADAWQAERGHFLVNGSSSGNHALLLATLAPGDEVVIGRDIHASLLAALILSGARPLWVDPRIDARADVSLGVAPEDVATTLARHPAAKLVVVTSPNYHGIAADLPGVVAAAHAHGVPVYVDEAWGAHFPFHPAFPPAAMASGADAAVTSVHKQLGALGQGSLLLLAGARLDQERIASAVAMTQTTTPLLPILASLDTARRQMALHGRALLERTLALAEDARRRLRAIPGITLLDGAALPGVPLDPTRLVIDVGGLGVSGTIVERALRERFAIAPELSDSHGIVCLLSIGNTPAHVDRLVTALATLARERDVAPVRREHVPGRSLGAVIAAGPQRCTPREAWYAPARTVPLAEAAGAVAAELIVPYPPGVPILAPGELIDAAKVEYLRAGLARGLTVRGASDPSLTTVRVVA